MNTGSNVIAKERTTLRRVLPLVALCGSLVAAPAGALELGELTVESNLGQPLRASIAYALAPNEMLSDTCVSVSKGPSTSGLPGIGPATVSTTERAIVISGKAAVREPVLGMRVTISCPSSTPKLSREYMMFVDPIGVATVATPLPAAQPQIEPQSTSAPRPTVDKTVAEFDEPADAPERTPAETITAMDSKADLEHLDVVLDGLLPTPAETVDVPDAELEEPRMTSTSPTLPAAIISTGARSESTSTLMWLIGGGLAIVAALLLFSRRVRARRRGSTPLDPATADPGSRQTDATADATEFADYDIDDDSPTQENLALDADLGAGTGLREGVEVDVALDFGVAATTHVDFELPFEPEAPMSDGDTDIIPPITRNIESILESEVLPEDDDYDMSVIMDATKMPQPEDVTERDLQAVAVDSLVDDEDEDGFRISQETGYSLLEQDYEDELTATQALNREIERAAAELASEFEAACDPDDTNALRVKSKG